MTTPWAAGRSGAAGSASHNRRGKKTQPSGTASAHVVSAAAWLNLVTATPGSTVNFRAWNLIWPPWPTYGRHLKLSSSAQSLLVAVPVLVGAAGRMPVGALSDKLGARFTFWWPSRSPSSAYWRSSWSATVRTDRCRPGRSSNA